MSEAFETRIKQVIQERSNTAIIEIIDNKKIKGKNLESLYLIVKVSRNLYQQGFMNMDICHVLGETLDNKLVIRRIEDNYKGIVEKKDVRFPEWKAYEF